jgi:molybdenum cofactor cytidylyltransferase
MNEREPVGAIILAAGASTRMGEPKQLLKLDGSTLIRRVADAALASKCASVVVVLGANSLRIAPEVESLPVIVVHNEQWSEGMGTSVRVGLEALKTSDSEQVLEAAVLMPCDQPHLGAEVLNRLIDAHRSSGKPIVVSGYEGTWGVPMLFARSLWPEILALSGNRGAQSIALRHAKKVECLPFPLGALDLDTREGYERLLAAAATSGTANDELAS